MTPLEITQLVSIIVSGLVALAVLFGVGVYFSERAKHKAGKKNRKELEQEAKEKAEREKLEALKQQQYENALRNIIREENQSLKKDVADLKDNIIEIKDDLSNNTVGTVTMLRDRMKAILDDCRDKGFASPGTKANWHELYRTYTDLGGNHFKEYVDQWKTTLDNLPDNPPMDRPHGIIYPNGLRPSQIAPSAKARAPRKKKNTSNNN